MRQSEYLYSGKLRHLFGNRKFSEVGVRFRRVEGNMQKLCFALLDNFPALVDCMTAEELAARSPQEEKLAAILFLEPRLGAARRGTSGLGIAIGQAWKNGGCQKQCYCS